MFLKKKERKLNISSPKKLNTKDNNNAGNEKKVKNQNTTVMQE
jgi:hypothetical protein